jgi:hypothetical protein
MKRSLIILFCLLSLQQIPAQDQLEIESHSIIRKTLNDYTSKSNIIPDVADAIIMWSKSVETGKPLQRVNNNHSLINDIENLHLLSPGVYFSLDGGWGSYPGNATINFNGSDYAYDPVLGGTIIYCSQGTYSYTVTPADLSKAISRGTVIVSSNNLVNVKIEIADAHRIDFYVTDQNSNALQGASVTFAGVTVFTDDTGLASFDRYPLGTYTYSVSNPGYISLENQTFEVMAQVEKIRITLNQYTYTATFSVKSGTDALDGASVKFNGIELITDAEGLATFKNLIAGTYFYTVTKTGYNEETGNIIIADGDVFQNVNLINLTGLSEASVNTVKLYPNPTSGNLLVTLPENHGEEVTIRITDPAGNVLLENKVPDSSSLIKLDLSGYDTGIYFVKISGNGIENSMKVVKN